MEKVKLTKKALSDFIQWTSTRYNDWLGYGTKKEAVLSAFHTIQSGHVVRCTVQSRDGKFAKKGEVSFRYEEENKTLTFECASPSGERPTNKSGGSRYWRTKQCGSKYTVDCESKSITDGERTTYFL